MKGHFSCFAIALMFVSSLASAAVWVEVEESGRTVEEAKQQCFRSAIQRTVGQLIISDTEVSGDTVTKDFIGDYSAGYVDDYEIQYTYTENNQVTLHMNVKVASSKIAERMRTNSRHMTTLSGENLAVKLETMLEQLEKGDRILSRVLGSYPSNAYILNSGSTEAVVGLRRQVYIDVPYKIQWSKAWIEALIETLDTVALNSNSCSIFPLKKIEELSLTLNAIKLFKEKTCAYEADVVVTHSPGNSWMHKKVGFYFTDLTSLDVVNSELRNPIGHQHVGLVVDLKDANGNVMDTRCAQIPTDHLISYARHSQEVESIHGDNLRPRLNGDGKIAGVMRIEGSGLKLSTVSRLDMRIEKTCS
jgi:hypothetical protein